MGGRESEFTERKDLVTSLSKETRRIVTSLQRYLDIMMLFKNLDLGFLDVSLEHHDHFIACTYGTYVPSLGLERLLDA